MRRTSATLACTLAACLWVIADLIAQCSCGPRYLGAPSSWTYRFDSVNAVPLAGLQAATEYAAQKWQGELNHRGQDLVIASGTGGIRVLVSPAYHDLNASWDPSNNTITISEDAVTDPTVSADVLKALLLHELGHALGLDDAPAGCDGQSVMAAVSRDSHPTTFTGCDSQSFDSFYQPYGELPCATDPAWPGCNSPLVIDTKGNGFKFTDAARGVWFDIDGDGWLDRVGWTAADSDDAFLAMDRNGNGVIDDGRELFGDVTPLWPGARQTGANGFEALKALELPCYGVSQANGIIDPSDEPFGRLVLWRDANHDGISEPDELTLVKLTALRSIDTFYVIGERARHGNAIRQISYVVWGGEKHQIVDVWLDRIVALK